MLSAVAHQSAHVRTNFHAHPEKTPQTKIYQQMQPPAQPAKSAANQHRDSGYGSSPDSESLDTQPVNAMLTG